MRKSARFLPVTVLVLTVTLLITAACDRLGGDSDRFERTEEESFSVSALPTLNVENFVGYVRISPGESGEIKVKATRWAENNGVYFSLNIVHLDSHQFSFTHSRK